MPDVTFNLHVHQPRRIVKNYQSGHLFDEGLNKIVLDRCAEKSYLRTNAILLEVLSDLKSFKMGMSISGVFLEECERQRPDVLESFQRIAQTGQVEVLGETYYHSLASIYPDKDEFREQVRMHRDAIKSFLSPKAIGKVMRNTELILDNPTAREAEKLGFKGIFSEGTEKILEWRSPNYVYKTPDSKIKVLLRNYRLSDDIGYRFSSKWWEEWPLTAEKFSHWLGVNPGQVVNVYLDYETFGEHHWQESNIFHFLKALPYFVDRNPHTQFLTPTEAVTKHEPVAELPLHWAISWADMERDVSAWLGNNMQAQSFKRVQGMEKQILQTKNAKLISQWRHLQTSDNLYYMCDKWWNEGDVHKYFSHYDTPKSAYHNYGRAMNNLLREAKDAVKKETA
ncbi:alpha-amylase [archaeon CG10_big_fil_rev_8_21_14_0_10_43_11]|nr:MAG: alpha-amylase [archaeon CG10_big_fil_rev_8_21_14_0_10_43_11]